MSRIVLLATASLITLVPAAALAQRVQENVVVTASPLSGNSNAIAASVGEIGREELLRVGGANIADALASIPGISATSFAGGASRPVIRGFDSSRVRLLENGIGDFDVSDIGPDHGVPLDPLAVQRVEVVRGAATVRYGSQAIGGVVNAINNRIPLMLPDDAYTGEVTGSYDSVSDGAEASALLDARAGHIAVHLDSFLRSTGDYDIPGGTQSNSWFKGNGQSLGASYFFGQSRAGAALIHYDASYGIPSDITHIRMEQTKGLFGSSFTIGKGAFKTLTVDAGYGDYKHDEVDPSGAINSTFLDREWDTRAEALFGAFGIFSSAALGVQAQHRDFSALGEGADYLLPTRSASEAVFAFGEMPLLTGLKVQLGGRVEQASIKGTPASLIPASLDFTPISGTASLVYDPTGMLTFGLTAASSSRAPNVTELFAHGAHDGPGTYETGDPGLTPERANSLEATARLHMPDFEVETSLWGVAFDNYIYGALTGRTCDEDSNCAFGPGDFKELFYRQGGAHFWGFEAKATRALLNEASGTLVADLSADYVRATLDSGGNVPRIPPYHLAGGLAWLSDAFDANLRLSWTGAQRQTGITETPTAGYAALDAGVTWHPGGEGKGFELSLIGKNLTDSTERNVVALNHDSVVLPGTNIRVLARYSF